MRSSHSTGRRTAQQAAGLASEQIGNCDWLVSRLLAAYRAQKAAAASCTAATAAAALQAHRVTTGLAVIMTCKH